MACERWPNAKEMGTPTQALTSQECLCMSEAEAERCGPIGDLNVELERVCALVIYPRLCRLVDSSRRDAISLPSPNQILRRRLSHVVYGVVFQPLGQ